jgi:hypothetical protein
MIMQVLLDRWAEIKSGNNGGTPTTDRVSEELNLLEALRFAGLHTIPGETSDIEVLINERHRRLTEMREKQGASPLKRFIRSVKTGKFFKDGEWTDDKNEATTFGSIGDAVNACSNRDLPDTELILSFGPEKMDITVPIS